MKPSHDNYLFLTVSRHLVQPPCNKLYSTESENVTAAHLKTTLCPFLFFILFVRKTLNVFDISEKWKELSRILFPVSKLVTGNIFKH